MLLQNLVHSMKQNGFMSVLRVNFFRHKCVLHRPRSGNSCCRIPRAKSSLKRIWLKYATHGVKCRTSSARGAQTNFMKFAELIDEAWTANDSQFNERYFTESVALVILFKYLEALIPRQEWYEQGLPSEHRYLFIGTASSVNSEAVQKIWSWICRVFGSAKAFQKALQKLWNR